MILKLKRKFIVTAMTAVTVLLVFILGAVNIVNAWTVKQETARLLDNLVLMLTRINPNGPPPPPDGFEPPPPPDGAPFRFEGAGSFGFLVENPDDNDRMSAVFFATWSSGDQVIRTDVSRISTVSEHEAVSLTAAVLSEGKTMGQMESYRFASGKNAAGETVYVFLENSNRRNSVVRVGILSGLAGLGGWLLMLGLVILMARVTIAPVARNLERQRQFVTDAGHEIKTPLAIIQANTEAMELIAGESKWSRNIKAQTARLTELTQELLTLARAEEAPNQMSFLPVDLSALTQKTLQMFQTPMEQKRLTLVADVATGVTVTGSESGLCNLCSILLENAVKYATEDSVLRLTLKAGEKTCSLRVENSCEKLPDCPPEQLFDRFYRGDAARAAGGFGIGLSAAQAITRQYSGRLEAQYSAEDWIVFTVTLPVHS